MSRALLAVLAAALIGCGAAQVPSPTTAGPSAEVTIGVPVANVERAVSWYRVVLGRDVETLTPVEGIVELHVAEGAWLQLMPPEGAVPPSPTIVRFATEDIDADARRLADAGIDIGEVVRIPGVVAFAELTDPFGNAVGLYEVLTPEP